MVNQGSQTQPLVETKELNVSQSNTYILSGVTPFCVTKPHNST
jgi:hypothetical protein